MFELINLLETVYRKDNTEHLWRLDALLSGILSLLPRAGASRRLHSAFWSTPFAIGRDERCSSEPNALHVLFGIPCAMDPDIGVVDLRQVLCRHTHVERTNVCEFFAYDGVARSREGQGPICRGYENNARKAAP